MNKLLDRYDFVAFKPKSDKVDSSTVSTSFNLGVKQINVSIRKWSLLVQNVHGLISSQLMWDCCLESNQTAKFITRTPNLQNLFFIGFRTIAIYFSATDSKSIKSKICTFDASIRLLLIVGLELYYFLLDWCCNKKRDCFWTYVCTCNSWYNIYKISILYNVCRRLF